MERLTRQKFIKGSNEEFTVCELCHMKCKDKSECWEWAVQERLAAYEDTGLTPEQVKNAEIHADCMESRALAYEAELSEYRKKQADGRYDGLENSNFEYITRSPLELSRAINLMLRCDVEWQKNFLRWLKEEREQEGAE